MRAMKTWMRIPAVACLCSLLTDCGDPQERALRALRARGYSLSVAEFHRAAEAGDLSAMQDFVRAGTAVQAADGGFHTALEKAMMAGQVEVSKWLIAQGVAEKARPPGSNWLLVAVRSRKLELVEIFADGAGRIDKDHALLEAAAHGDHEIVERLLDGQTDSRSLHESFRTAAGGGHLAVCDLLLRAGAMVDAAGGDEGDTPLMLAAAGGHAAVVKLLLANGANIGKGNLLGLTALEHAHRAGHVQIVELLEGAK